MILTEFIRTVADVFDAHSACLLSPLKKRDTEPLSVISWYSISNNFNPLAKIKKGEGLIGWVYKEQKFLHFNHFERDPQNLLIYSGDLQIKAIMIAPLPEKRGVLVVDSKNRYAFPPKSNKILIDFANLASELLISLEGRAELVFLRRFRDWFLEDYSSMDVLIPSLLNLVGLDSAVIIRENLTGKEFELVYKYKIEDDSLRLGEALKLEKGLVNWVFKNRKSIFISINRQQELKTFFFHTKEDIKANFFLGIYLNFYNYPYCIAIFGEKKRVGFSSKALPLIERALSLILRDNFRE